MNAKQDIQKTSKIQMLIVLGFIGYIVLVAFLFHDNFSEQPYDLLGLNSSQHSE